MALCSSRRLSRKSSQEKGWLLVGFGVFAGSDEGLAGADWLSGAFSAGFGGFWLGVGSDSALDFAGDSGASGELTGVAVFCAVAAAAVVGAILGLFPGVLVVEVGLTAVVMAGDARGF